MKAGIVGVHHVGLSVPDLQAAKNFYVGSLGFAVVDEDNLECSDSLDAVTGLRNVACRMMLLSLGNLYLELFEFRSPLPSGGGAARRVCDFGFTHLTFEVADIQQAYADLSRAGVVWNCPPVEIAPGYKTTYGRDPFGNVLEIQQVSDTKNYSFSKLSLPARTS